jgi:hypothetical protein
MGAMYVKQCKVCNSVFRDRIESLSLDGFNPQRVYDYLQSLQDPNEQSVVQRENINPSAIRRHIDNHFQKDEAVKVKIAEAHSKIDRSRDMLNSGAVITIDKINSLCHMVDVAIIQLEEVDNDVSVNNKTKYQIRLATMNTARGLIESLAKLTGELKQEGTIDINFFSNEIGTFADIVLESIRNVDKQFGLLGKMEEQFSIEFQSCWDTYKQKQIAVLNGEAKPPQQNLNNEFNSGY